ncbi:PepSY domain-containing protein [Colwellia sp. 20A7]|uniref:PepSY domain-containing protein n=1 Tax=Colwellia sp. 20A7 TaxID=2689569 RepID=UPI00135B48FC|nr:PepSY domain-containing protein [Colwellia sp. 20A7]
MKLVKWLHKWLSVLIAIQLFIWLGSGLFFNLMDSNKARGNENRLSNLAVMKIDHERLLEPSYILSQFKIEKPQKPVNSIKLIHLIDQPYYLLNHHLGLYQHFYNEHSLVGAYTGEMKIIDRTMAKKLAKATYSGTGNIGVAERISPPIDDFPKEQNALWRVNFDDALYTSVYIDASSGRVIGHSNDDKRFADFFFMLHFMDYGTSGGFNNWQIILFSILTLIFCITGFVWTLDLLIKGRYKIK